MHMVFSEVVKHYLVSCVYKKNSPSKAGFLLHTVEIGACVNVLLLEYCYI